MNDPTSDDEDNRKISSSQNTQRKEEQNFPLHAYYGRAQSHVFSKKIRSSQIGGLQDGNSYYDVEQPHLSHLKSMGGRTSKASKNGDGDQIDEVDSIQTSIISIQSKDFRQSSYHPIRGETPVNDVKNLQMNETIRSLNQESLNQQLLENSYEEPLSPQLDRHEAEREKQRMQNISLTLQEVVNIETKTNLDDLLFQSKELNFKEECVGSYIQQDTKDIINNLQINQSSIHLPIDYSELRQSQENIPRALQNFTNEESPIVNRMQTISISQDESKDNTPILREIENNQTNQNAQVQPLQTDITSSIEKSPEPQGHNNLQTDDFESSNIKQNITQNEQSNFESPRVRFTHDSDEEYQRKQSNMSPEERSQREQQLLKALTKLSKKLNNQSLDSTLKEGGGLGDPSKIQKGLTDFFKLKKIPQIRRKEQEDAERNESDDAKAQAASNQDPQGLGQNLENLGNHNATHESDHFMKDLNQGENDVVNLNLEDVKQTYNFGTYQTNGPSDQEQTKFEGVNTEEREKLERAAEEGEEEGEQRTTSFLSNIMYLSTSFMFIIIFVTELDLTSQRKIGFFTTSMLDNTIFDLKNGLSRKDITQASQLYLYMKDALIPFVYDEVQKKTQGSHGLTKLNNPGVNDTLIYENSTSHFIGNFNYYVGMRLSFKRMKFSRNEDDITYTVLPQRQDYFYDFDEIVDDYQQDIVNNETGTVYTYKPGDGKRFTGAYIAYFSGQLTFAEALATLDDIKGAGLFEEEGFLYFSLEMLVYNEGYQCGGFTSFEYYRMTDGTFQQSITSYNSIFPSGYSKFDISSFTKTIFIFIYILGVLINIVQLIYTFYLIIKEYIKSKELDIMWYDYMDIISLAFCVQSMYFWFVLYSRRYDFELPCKDLEEFQLYVEQSYYIAQYLNISSMAVLLLCIKNLRILNIYFPAFGILFDTFRNAKTKLMFFFVLLGLFMIAYMFAGHLFFGWNNPDFKTIPSATMSLFKTLCGEFRFGSLHASNPAAGALFFFTYVIFFFLILLNLLVTIVSESYDSLRQKKALDSMAQAQILSRENTEYIKKWLNLVLCRLEHDDKDKPEGSDSEEDGENDEEDPAPQQPQAEPKKGEKGKKSIAQMRRMQMMMMVEKEKEKENKKDLHTICLHNKAKLFGKNKLVKTKEEMENELLAAKKEILVRTHCQRVETIRRFQKTDQSAIDKLRSSIVYLIFIANFVTMLILQLQITESGQATNALRDYVNGQEFQNILYYTPLDPSNSVFDVEVVVEVTTPNESQNNSISTEQTNSTQSVEENSEITDDNSTNTTEVNKESGRRNLNSQNSALKRIQQRNISNKQNIIQRKTKKPLKEWQKAAKIPLSRKLNNQKRVLQDSFQSIEDLPIILPANQNSTNNTLDGNLTKEDELNNETTNSSTAPTNSTTDSSINWGDGSYDYGDGEYDYHGDGWYGPYVDPAKNRTNDTTDEGDGYYEPVIPEENEEQPQGITDEQILELIPSLTVNDIFYPTQIYDWLQQSLLPFVYDNPDDAFLRQNYFFGDTRVRITFRLVQVPVNNNTITNQSIPRVRAVDSLGFSSGVNKNEVVKKFVGAKSNTNYWYRKPGNESTYLSKGGFVINLPANKTEAEQMIENFILDDIIDDKFATMVIEMATFNPTYQLFVLQTIWFHQTNAGLIYPLTRARAMRKDFYQNSSDNFRALQELIYVSFVFYYLYCEMLDFIKHWQKMVQAEAAKRIEMWSCDQPDWVERLAVFVGADYIGLQESGTVSYIIDNDVQFFLTVSIIFCMLRWSFKQVLRFLRVLSNFVGSDFFKLFNVISISISMSLIGTWITIIAQEQFLVSEDGLSLEGTAYTHIDLLSDLGDKIDTYNMFSSINAIIIFWRILQFFSFSFNLSAFTGILAQAKNDIIFFMLMFMIILMGFSIMGYSSFGQSDRHWEDLFVSVIECFKLMVEFYIYEDLYAWNPSFAPIFFTMFMLLCDHIMKNMFIAIICGHYEEYNSFEIEEEEGEGGEEDAAQVRAKQSKMLMFKAIRGSFCTDWMERKAKRDRVKPFMWWVKKWDIFEAYVFRETHMEEDSNNTENAAEFAKELTSKFDRPKYEKNVYHAYMKPYLVTQQKSEEDINFEGNSNINDQSNDDAVDNEEIQLKIQKKIAEKEKIEKIKYGPDNEDNQVLMYNYIDIIPQNFELVDLDDMTSANVWVAALEKFLFHQSGKQILFSDMHEPEDNFRGSVDIPVYHDSQFNDFQVQYLMKDNFERTLIWKASTPGKKWKLWRVLDFEKYFQDENRIRSQFNERLENFVEILNQIEEDLRQGERNHDANEAFLDASLEELEPKIINKKAKKGGLKQRRTPLDDVSDRRRQHLEKLQKVREHLDQAQDLITKLPIMTFKKIVKSPELSDLDFNRASIFMKNLWCKHTTLDDKYELWFHKFNTYHRVKLWNMLAFSEDYLIHILNTPKFFRQDLALKVSQVLKKVKEEYIQHLQNEYEWDKENFRDSTDKRRKKELEKQRLQIEKIKNGQIKMEDVARMTTFDIRARHINSQFFLDCLEILKKKKQQKMKKLRDTYKTRVFDTLLAEKDTLDRLNFEEQQKASLKRKPTRAQIEAQEEQDKKDAKNEFQLPENPSLGDVLRLAKLLKIKKEQEAKERGEVAKEAPAPVVGGGHQRHGSEAPLLPSGGRNLIELTALRLAEKVQKMASQNVQDNYEFVKIPRKTYMECLKTYYGLMINGGAGGKRLHQVRSKADSYDKYTYLMKTMDKNEQRLPLWLAMDHEQKLQMITGQYIDLEAEVLTMLMLEEAELSPGGNYLVADHDEKLERALDNQIYEKYRRLTEMQAIKATMRQTDARMEQLRTEDYNILSMIHFVNNTAKELTKTKTQLLKDLLKKHNDNEHWRQQYDKKLIAMHTNASKK